jgi:hypothetical protein
MSDVLQTLIGLASLLVAIIVGWGRLKGWWNSKAVSKWRREVSQIRQRPKSIELWVTRRRFLVLLAMIAGIVVGFLIPFRIARGIRLSISRLAVVNRKTNVIHEAAICQDHLPSAKNRLRTPIPHTARYHGDRAIHILTELARQAPDEDAVRLLLLAKDLKPSAVHIYDMLIRILGRLKRYESIHLLLNDAERGLSELIAAEVHGSKRSLELMRAKEAIRMRRWTVNARAAFAVTRVR